MYVYRNDDLPPDPTFPVDLNGLGYFLNNRDQIRQIDNPEEGYKYKVNRNDRFNIKHREAINECIRPMVMERLKNAGMEVLHLPLCSAPNDTTVPILVSKDIANKSRIIVFCGEPSQDLGIWAYRSIHEGINHGSAVNLTKAVLGEKMDNDVGLIIANTGQLIWHCASERAVTQQTWLASPRPYGNWGQPTMSWRNKIPHNNDWTQHVQYVFKKVLWPYVNGKKTRIDIIGMSEGGLAALKYLQADWHVWQPYISGICLGDPQQTTYADLDMGTIGDPLSFTSFIASRCRAYVLSSEPLGTTQAGYRLHGCNCYSSGESLNSECIIPAAWKDMLQWLDTLYKDPEHSEHVMLCADDMDDQMRREIEEQAMDHEKDTEAKDLEWKQELEAAAKLKDDAPDNQIKQDENVKGDQEPVEEPADISQKLENLKVVDTNVA
ncbi:hypothetical protein N7528_009476 [Penicillium herquei]|nr:hypothetical protein N7528_009476 [Penicillium herquei]